MNRPTIGPAQHLYRVRLAVTLVADRELTPDDVSDDLAACVEVTALARELFRLERRAERATLLRDNGRAAAEMWAAVGRLRDACRDLPGRVRLDSANVEEVRHG